MLVGREQCHRRATEAALRGILIELLGLRRALTNPSIFCQKIWSLQGISGAVRHLARKNWDAGPDEEDWEEIPLPDGKDIPNMREVPDWYFAPCLFTSVRRREHALPSRLLYADLDQVHPESCKIKPTVAWETSPGSYQGIWILDRSLAVVKKNGEDGPFEDLNRRLTYYVGADKGGWSSTKVLRPPGTESTKYGRSRKKRFTVRLLYINGPRYMVEEITELVKTQPAGYKLDNRDWGKLPGYDEVFRQWKHKFPARVRQLLRVSKAEPGDDRSARLWELHHLLLGLGMSPEEVLVVVRQSAWNKYRGQRRELSQLKLEIAKAVEIRKGQVVEHGELERVRANTTASNGNGTLTKKQMQAWKSRAESVGLGYFTYREFMTAHFPEPQWLVHGFWGLGSYGVWAGEFKSYKTVTLLDFALSVSSGKPFLGKFEVHQPGGVLYAHDEGTPGLIQDRMRRIASRKGVADRGYTNGGSGDFSIEFADDIPLHIASWPKLNLTEKESQAKLTSYCGAVNPRVIILESFYLMAQDIDENSAHEVIPALSFLKELAHNHNVAVIVSHHYNKSADESKRPGLRISGSTVFGRWYESAVYLERKGDDTEGRASIAAEHREQKGTGRMNLKVEMDVEAEDHYNVEIVEADMKMEGAPTGSVTKATIDVSCPECGAEPNVRCKDDEGKDRVFHYSRKQRAKGRQADGGDLKDKVSARDVRCPKCEAPPGTRCRSESGSTGYHRERKELAEVEVVMGPK